MLSEYNFRLSARRFIQELFQDVDFQQVCQVLLNMKVFTLIHHLMKQDSLLQSSGLGGVMSAPSLLS